MARRIYWITLILSVIAGVVLYFTRESFSQNTLITILFIFLVVMVASVHGVLAHTISLQFKSGLIVYPLLMGVLFAVLFFICIFLIVPLFCPNFLN